MAGEVDRKLVETRRASTVLLEPGISLLKQRVGNWVSVGEIWQHGDMTCNSLPEGEGRRSFPESGRRRTPPPLNEVVHRQMSKMPRADTRIERAVRSQLHRRGLRFRVNVRNLPGSPDIAFTRARIAVFIDGCFWHGCPIHGRLPKSNREWWIEKLRRNQERDFEKDRALEVMGWLPLHYWEHDDPEEIADEIEWLWRSFNDKRGRK